MQDKNFRLSNIVICGKIRKKRKGWVHGAKRKQKTKSVGFAHFACGNSRGFLCRGMASVRGTTAADADPGSALRTSCRWVLGGCDRSNYSVFPAAAHRLARVLSRFHCHGAGVFPLRRGSKSDFPQFRPQRGELVCRTRYGNAGGTRRLYGRHVYHDRAAAYGFHAEAPAAERGASRLARHTAAADRRAAPDFCRQQFRLAG